MILIKKRGLSWAIIFSIITGSMLGSVVTITYLEYKIKKDAGRIISQVIVEEREMIMRELGKGLEEEINNIIDKKKGEVTKEIQKSIEQILKDKREELGKEMEKAIDEYIKMKIRNIFNP